MDATDVMELLRVDDLKSIAKQAGIPKTITRKADLIAALDRYLRTDPEQFLSQLDPAERNLLAEAVHNDNRVSPVTFAAKYQVNCPFFRRDSSLIHLVVRQERNSPEIEIAHSIADILRPLLEKPMAPSAATVNQIPVSLNLGEDDVRPIHVFAGERTAFAELRRVLRLVQAGKVRIQAKSRRPTPATERLIAASLAVPDFDIEFPKEVREEDTILGGSIRAHAWVVVIQQCGWAKPHGETLKLTKDGTNLLQNFSAEAFRVGVGGLIVDDTFDELNRINHIRGQTGNAQRWMSEPADRRETILDGVAEWLVNRWLTFDEAYRFLNACGHEFCVTESPMDLYFSEQRYGYITDGDGIDRQYLRAFLMETLATLGLIDVAYVYPHFLWPELGGGWGTDMLDFCGRYDGLLYVRLNPLGSYCLGGSEDYTPPAAESRVLFTVLPNLEIAVAGEQPLLPGDISTLEQFAVKKSDRLWCLEPPLILDYLEGGASLDELCRFLEEHSAEDIPATVRTLFQDLKAKAGAIVGAEQAWLVELRDNVLAALIANDSKAGKLCLLAGERHVVVAKKNERAFRTAVKKLGYILPR